MLMYRTTAIAFLLFGVFPVIAEGSDPNGAVDLFNGNNLDGWYVVTAMDGRTVNQDIFTVEDGAIRVYGHVDADSNQPFAGLITEKSYGDFHLHLDYKWGEKKFKPRQEVARDAGIIFHVDGSDTIWPVGVELQIQEGDTGDIWAIGTRVTSRVHRTDRNYSPDGSLVTRGSNGEPFSRFHRDYCWEQPGWNHVEIIAEGNRATYKVNGHVVNEVVSIMQWDAGRENYMPLNRGKILLQAEGSEVFYRNIRIETNARQ
jgi:hypothetical protein